MDTNKYGLTRPIPEEIKRIVRQKSGFGCVLCGLWLYNYHHIDPPFFEAKEHDPNRICILCSNHHDEFHRGKSITTQQILDAYNNPKAKEVGFSNKPFLELKRPIKVNLGNFEFNNPHTILKIFGQTILAIEDLDEQHIAITGKFFGKDSNLLLDITKNEFKIISGAWDVTELNTSSFKIFEKKSQLSLTVRISNDTIIFDDINMLYENVRLIGKKGKKLEIYYEDKLIISHTPSIDGNGEGITCNGYVEVDVLKDGCVGIESKGGTILHSGVINKIGKNKPCPCGSRKKYKMCCGRTLKP